MLFKNQKEITEIYRGKLPIMEIYYGKFLVWQACRSCYGKGYWISDKPWLDDDAWKN